jgi:aminoglycoside phosphotransferase (APT) family kinase protein
MDEDARIDAAQVASILQSQFNDLAPPRVVFLGEGCDSFAFEVNDDWVFRFPKRDAVAQQLAIESRVLPVLAAQSPLRLPAFSFHGRPSDAFPFPFAGYRKIPGVPAILIDERTMPVIRWAPAMGRFLSWLHRFPVRDGEALGVPRRDVGALIEEVRTDALDDLDRVAEVMASAPLRQWREFFTAGCLESAAAPTPVLVHGDLAREHVLWDAARQEVTGIIDWSEMAVGDRSIDLAAFFHWGGRSCVDAVLSAYDGPVDDGVLVRAHFLAACRGVADVAFGLDTGRQEYIEAGTRALSLCLT